MKISMLCLVLMLLCASTVFAQNCDGRREGENTAFNGDFEQTYGTCTSNVGEATASIGALGWNGQIGSVEGHTFYMNRVQQQERWAIIHQITGLVRRPP